MEHWVKVKGYDNYMVSSYGRVFSISSNIILKGDIDRYGYRHYMLKKKRYTGHRLVATHFIPGDTRLQVNHIDGNKLNNRVDNLEWVTNKQNMIHSMVVLGKSFKGERNPSCKLSKENVVLIKEDLKSGVSQHEIARKYSISRSTISMIAIKKIWNHI